jgi:hypothetical protein
MKLLKSAAFILLLTAFVFGLHIFQSGQEVSEQLNTDTANMVAEATDYSIGITPASSTKKASITAPVNTKRVPDRSAKAAIKNKSAAKAKKGTSRITSLLGDLQQRVNLKRPVPAKESKATQGRALNSRMGIRQVDVKNDTTDSVYTIPSGDVFLDSSAVGEVGPSDDIVQ